MHRAQIEELQGAQDRDRMTLVVTKLYFKEGRVKIELRVAKGKSCSTSGARCASAMRTKKAARRSAAGSEAEVRWQVVDQGRGAGKVRVVESDGDWAVVEATQAFPIGATLRGVEAETGTEYRIKGRGGKKLRDGCFCVEGRFVGMTREQRERLLAALSAPGSATGEG